MTLDIESCGDKSGGFKAGEMMVLTAGRNTGKSQIMQYMSNWNAIFGEPTPAFTVVDAGTKVDGEPWCTVKCRKDVSAWVRTMDNKNWYEYIDQRGYMDSNIFDMNEKLYTMLAIKFS